MAFLNALGRVSRHGPWRFRHLFRASDPTGRLDLTDRGLVDFSRARDVVLTVTPRPPFAGHGLGCDPAPVLSASLAAGTLRTINPGWIEALFPAGWSAGVRPGLYDVRVSVTIGPETATILDQPVEIV